MGPIPPQLFTTAPTCVFSEPPHLTVLEGPGTPGQSLSWPQVHIQGQSSRGWPVPMCVCGVSSAGVMARGSCTESCRQNLALCVCKHLSPKLWDVSGEPKRAGYATGQGMGLTFP